MEIAEHLTQRLSPHGVRHDDRGGAHLHEPARREGPRVRAPVTAALRGRLRDNPKTRAEFLSLTRDRAGVR